MKQMETMKLNHKRSKTMPSNQVQRIHRPLTIDPDRFMKTKIAAEQALRVSKVLDLLEVFSFGSMDHILGHAEEWLSVVNLVRFHRCVMAYKIVNKQCPESLRNMFQQRCSISNYNTRNYRDLPIPKLNLELTKERISLPGH